MKQLELVLLELTHGEVIQPVNCWLTVILCLFLKGIIIRHNTENRETDFEADGLGTDPFALQGYAIAKGHFLDGTREGELKLPLIRETTATSWTLMTFTPDFAVTVPRRNFYFGAVSSAQFLHNG